VQQRSPLARVCVLTFVLLLGSFDDLSRSYGKRRAPSVCFALVKTCCLTCFDVYRCFPHCCPQHVDRSYCGSSLDVLVRLEPEPDVSQSTGRGQAGVDVHKLFVFVRFETQNEEILPATARSLSYLRSVSQSERNPEASWLEGVLQSRARGSDALASRTPSGITTGGAEPTRCSDPPSTCSRPTFSTKPKLQLTCRTDHSICSVR
jgi:hypothetical protein